MKATRGRAARRSSTTSPGSSTSPGSRADGHDRLTSAGGESTRRRRRASGSRSSRSSATATRTSPTAPGTQLRKQIPQIRRAVQARIDEYGGVLRPRTSAGGGRAAARARARPARGRAGRSRSAVAPARELLVGRRVADQLVGAERQLAVGEAALELLEAVAGLDAAAEVERQAELARRSRSRRRSGSWTGARRRCASAVPDR